MRNINIDCGWEFALGSFDFLKSMNPEYKRRIVDLPHDYMIESDPTADAPAGPASGFFTAGVANYTRYLDIPAEWEGEQVGLKFDGAMMNATVEVNNCKVLLQHYGYAPFFADITPYLYFGERNRVTVTVNPSMQPNCRWYSGAGIYRSVELVHTPQLHMANDGIYVYTREVEYENQIPVRAYLQASAEIKNETAINHLARVEIKLVKEEAYAAAAEAGQEAEPVICRSQLIEVGPMSAATARMTLTVEAPMLWDVDTPNLYRVIATVTDQGTFRTHMLPAENATTDSDTALFGIRTITADAVRGLRINGKSVKLKGGCLHHDNGILGIESMYDAEYRKLSRLKEIGYNAVRTTHNPPSAVFMEVCDRIGMYVFDEAFDAWGTGKQPGDYNQFFDADWEKDLSAFIRRDRCHPSVIIWSTGNEIPERGGLNNGYLYAAKLADFVRAMDGSRPISNGICSFWSGLDDHLMLEGLKSMKSALVQNADTSSVDLTWENYTEAFAADLDIVGYNYMENRYLRDHKMYPERVILGSENYPKEIGFRWPVVENTPYIIGDFTWTAWDYIGEAGIGKTAHVEKDDPMLAMGPFALMSHTSPFPWRLANDADVDINGNLLPQGAYRSVVWGGKETSVFSYDPDHFDKVEIISPWGFTDIHDCWNWPGKEGRPVRLMVVSPGEEVEVFVNGSSIGRQPVSTEAPLPKTAVFDTVYTPGKVEAVSYTGGQEISRGVLSTTGEAASICLSCEKDVLSADDHSLLYVSVEIVDEEGNVVPTAALPLTAEVTGTEGTAVLAGFGSGSPITDENYTLGRFTSCRGRATAVLRAGHTVGTLLLTVKAEGLGEASLEVLVK